MRERDKVRVTNHPGYEDFTGVILLVMDDVPHCLVNGNFSNGHYPVVVHKDNVTLITESDDHGEATADPT